MDSHRRPNSKKSPRKSNNRRSPAMETPPDPEQSSPRPRDITDNQLNSDVVDPATDLFDDSLSKVKESQRIMDRNLNLHRLFRKQRVECVLWRRVQERKNTLELRMRKKLDSDEIYKLVNKLENTPPAPMKKNRRWIDADEERKIDDDGVIQTHHGSRRNLMDDFNEAANFDMKVDEMGELLKKMEVSPHPPPPPVPNKQKKQPMPWITVEDGEEEDIGETSKEDGGMVRVRRGLVRRLFDGFNEDDNPIEDVNSEATPLGKKVEDSPHPPPLSKNRKVRSIKWIHEEDENAEKSEEAGGVIRVHRGSSKKLLDQINEVGDGDEVSPHPPPVAKKPKKQVIIWIDEDDEEEEIAEKSLKNGGAIRVRRGSARRPFDECNEVSSTGTTSSNSIGVVEDEEII